MIILRREGRKLSGSRDNSKCIHKVGWREEDLLAKEEHF